MRKFAKANSENQKLFRHCKVVDVKEFKFTTSDNKESKALVLYIPFPFHKENKSNIKKIVNYFTELRKQYTFVVAKRTINHYTHQNYQSKQRVPQNRTLTAVYDAVLEDLLLPGYVVGKRMRVR